MSGTVDDGTSAVQPREEYFLGDTVYELWGERWITKMNQELARILKLPLPDQLQLVEELWDHIAASGESLPIPDWQKNELDQRRCNFEAQPESAIPWEVARKQLRSND